MIRFDQWRRVPLDTIMRLRIGRAAVGVAVTLHWEPATCRVSSRAFECNGDIIERQMEIGG